MPEHGGWPLLAKRLATWALFLLVLYLARDFFFVAFMTFLFSYLTLAIVGWGMRRLSPDRERLGLRRLLTLGVFILVPLILLGVGLVVGPHLLAEGQQLAGWMNQVRAESEIARVLERYVGPSQFKAKYGGPTDPRYQQALAEFRKTGESHVQAYNDFPHLEAWIEAGFTKKFLEGEQGRLRHQLTTEGASSKAFADWFLTSKVPVLQAQAKAQDPARGAPPGKQDPLVRAAGSVTPEQLLERVRQDPDTAAALREEWIQDTLARAVPAARASTAYQDQFRAYYEQQRGGSAAALPYTFDQYIQLQKVRPQGPRAFGEALNKMMPTRAEETDARLRADFEAAQQHELFKEWWATNSTAQFIRHQVDSRLSGNTTDHMARVITSLLNIPLDLTTALILSLFICIDFPNLKRLVQGTRQTWLRDVHDELAPALTMLGVLTGRSMHAQGLIALCNATMLCLALLLLGVAHPVLLATAAFVLCLVPTLGMVLAWALIVAVAIFQPGGGLGLALQASVAVVLVICLENFVFSPRIMGRMMELHPVLMIALLPVAQYFFGIWGLILATPVAVYVIHVVILRRGLPGGHESKEKPEPVPDISEKQPLLAPASLAGRGEILEGADSAG
jgi:predicted PurR-regulated permease PerM